MNAPPKTTLKAHKVCWSVVVYHPTERLIGLYTNKLQAEEEAANINGAFVLPPVVAWGGKDSA